MSFLRIRPVGIIKVHIVHVRASCWSLNVVWALAILDFGINVIANFRFNLLLQRLLLWLFIKVIRTYWCFGFHLFLLFNLTKFYYRVRVLGLFAIPDLIGLLIVLNHGVDFVFPPKFARLLVGVHFDRR
jgi:1-acyl-sn-glycerol-3-phosphate acyltransferase